MSDPHVPLQMHPAHAMAGIRGVAFHAARDGAGLRLVYELKADLERLAIPAGPGGTRRDELWKETCFELFLCQPGSSAYSEYNFSSNGDWAAYEFDAYREGGRDLDTPAPQIRSDRSGNHLTLSAVLTELPSALVTGDIKLGPAVILKDLSGQTSYWALNHPSIQPDFHRIETFTHNLD